MKQKTLWMLAAILTCGLMLTSCSKDDEENENPDQPVVLNCVKPDYLKAGDKVALISPSYFTLLSGLIGEFITIPSLAS